MPTLHSHTHWQAPQADTQAKACQRVCLSHAEKKKLKIPFPSKNFKNAITQSDTKTFGQLVAKLNKDNGFRHGRQERQPVTRVWQKWRFSAPQTHLWLIKVWFSASTFVVKIATFAKPETVSEN